MDDRARIEIKIRINRAVSIPKMYARVFDIYVNEFKKSQILSAGQVSKHSSTNEFRDDQVRSLLETTFRS